MFCVCSFLWLNIFPECFVLKLSTLKPHTCNPTITSAVNFCVAMKILTTKSLLTFKYHLDIELLDKHKITINFC